MIKKNIIKVNIVVEEGISSLNVVLSENRRTLEQFVYFSFCKGEKESCYEKMKASDFFETDLHVNVKKFFQRRSISDIRKIHKINDEVRAFIDENRNRNDIVDMEDDIMTSNEMLTELLKIIKKKAEKGNNEGIEKKKKDAGDYIAISSDEFNNVIKPFVTENKFSKEQILAELETHGYLIRNGKDSRKTSTVRIKKQPKRCYKIRINAEKETCRKVA